jgi:predicted transcriptional regulator
MTTAEGSTKPTGSDAAQLRVNEQKWSKLLMQAGWTVIPNVIIERQKALGLDPLDVNILLHLASYWWTPGGKPHPAKGTIAQAIDVDPRTVQRRIARLEAGGLIRREERRIQGLGSRTNVYHFDGLIEAAQPYAQEKLEEIAERDAARKRRAARKGKPKLKLVKADEA